MPDSAGGPSHTPTHARATRLPSPHVGPGTVFDDSIAEFASAYAKQNASGYSEFKGQIDDGQPAAGADN